MAIETTEMPISHITKTWPELSADAKADIIELARKEQPVLAEFQRREVGNLALKDVTSDLESYLDFDPHGNVINFDDPTERRSIN